MKDIDKLLEKYFEGETSLEEEQMLRKYFKKNTIADKHKVYAPLFNYFEEKASPKSFRQNKTKLILKYTSIAAACVGFVFVAKSVSDMRMNYNSKQSFVYVDGKKITDAQTMNSEVVLSIQNITDLDKELIDSQIGLLEDFN